MKTEGRPDAWVRLARDLCGACAAGASRSPGNRPQGRQQVERAVALQIDPQFVREAGRPAEYAAADPDPELFDLDTLPLRQPTPLCNGVPQAIAPGMQPDRTEQQFMLPTTTVPTTTVPAATLPPTVPAGDGEFRKGGPGGDLLDALEAGYFEQVGITGDFPSMAGTWAG